MKGLLVSLFGFLLLGCSQSQDVEDSRIADFIMPAAEFSELSRLEVVIAIDDVMNPDGSAPEYLVNMLKGFGVTGAANFTYTWGDPEGYLLIDGNLHRFSSNADAVTNLMGGMHALAEGGVVKLDGVGDAAINVRNQSVIFVVDEVKVTLTAMSKDIQLEAVARAYGSWLANKKRL